MWAGKRVVGLQQDKPGKMMRSQGLETKLEQQTREDDDCGGVNACVPSVSSRGSVERRPDECPIWDFV